uniref:LRAT domain-containing protein n=1 Tax=Magallana gigas TaxID=29159 RepID=A0A8W8LA51_MAGGI
MDSKTLVPIKAGNEEVVHLAGVDNGGQSSSVNPSHSFTISGKIFSKAMVKKDSVWNVAQGSKVKINNDKDEKLKYAHSTY